MYVAPNLLEEGWDKNAGTVKQDAFQSAELSEKEGMT